MPQYVDQIIAGTWSGDGAVRDICKTLSVVFRESGATVKIR
jgi:hypothetical protein